LTVTGVQCSATVNEAETEEEAVNNTTDLVGETKDIEMEDSCEAALNEEVDSVKDVCTPALATRIHRVLEINILPQLHKCLTKEVLINYFSLLLLLCFVKFCFELKVYVISFFELTLTFAP